MKQVTVTLFIVLLVCAPLAGTGAAEKGEMHFGLKAGPSFSFARSESERSNMLTTFAGGVFMSYNVSPMFQIQPEILYVGRGWKETSGSVTLTNKIGYIDFDVLFKLTIPSQGKVSSSLGIGPYLGLKISDSYEFNVSTPPEVDEAMTLIYEHLNSYDIGLVVSGELDIALESGGIILFDLRLTYGFQQLFDEIVIEGVPVASLDLQSMGFQILAGYAF